MTANPVSPGSGGPSAVSFVMPCYNEQAIVGYTIERLLTAFERTGCRLELVAVDNGSTDGTGEILRRLADRHPEVVYHRVERNVGYGHGVLSGLPRCRAPWIGVIAADGQVDAEDVARLFQAVQASPEPVVGKVRRRFRMDGLRRKVVSVAYNALVRLLWPRLDSIDINGTPKILPAEAVAAMGLQSTGWLLDPEIMIKAHYMGLRVMEFNVFARMRGGGSSHVRSSTVWEFIGALLAFRFSPRWRREFRRAGDSYNASRTPGAWPAPAGAPLEANR